MEGGANYFRGHGGTRRRSERGGLGVGGIGGRRGGGAGAPLLGIPVYNKQRGHMTEPGPVPPYPTARGAGGS
jgi:hypothetical protein